ncbi:Flavin-dependent oxidoreductase, luciferase family (includes alkanesulfonate monooxygenase SsuD and methylene tetrahydromethanopterin reductase) [Amycolatopsis arida]|uniref:Flavin-dependent oxidoreductase, luciferase family (Includes alkanesulfonate monooxygenase SsuD and methylene tetrahydromethanopterin reductase) n=1 Tax=Amycolatopsis arida TaxID=587909 RepID=A0A1I5VAP7_9PSEU|nr:LLM class flavin-dependent oxidoreductase [Amycolatopsis arida]TDX91213.1 alkanesulfonate monooxygenase SsuD/methylene tetrahydromethanopterin reductase-like flavin-dependent oxidoreductase (luciferase family) [Amycolatopsis arida]SFQ04634.1 Flavin-dependent oxidoreductase, luciferase family (includes alkanesulfonate monooxygenase SsuD and methylene tetrahydromethanopterin reductase) [Amycolatopsis arida]
MTAFGLMLFTDTFGGDVPSKEVLDWSLAYVREAERGGWDEVWTTEHHFTTVVQNPSAIAMAAFLLGRTRLRVGTAVAVLPNHHPVALAEQTALLHHLSDGRFTLGVGRGQPLLDLEIFGDGLAGYRDIEEPLALLESTLREGRAKANGQRFAFDEVRLVPDPPERPPLALSVGSAASARLAGRLGVSVILAPFASLADKRVLLDEHARAAAAHGHRIDPGDNIDSTYFAIDDTTESARQLLIDGVRALVLRGAPGSRALIERPATTPEAAEAMAREVVDHLVAGDPDECVRQLRERRRLLGTGRVILMPEGAGSREATLRTVRRAGPEVFARVAAAAAAPGGSP